MVATDHAKVMRFLSQPQTLEQIEAGFDAVKKASASGDSDQLNAARRPNFIRVPRSSLRGGNVSVFKLAIQKVVPEYRPYLSAGAGTAPAEV